MLGNGLIGSSFLSQNIYFLTLVGLPVTHCFDINIAGFGLALLIIPCSWYFGDKLGRRPLYLIGVAGNIIGMAIVGGLGYADSSNKGATWTLAIMMLVSQSLTPEFK
jgi:hypothetical protein